MRAFAEQLPSSLETLEWRWDSRVGTSIAELHAAVAFEQQLLSFHGRVLRRLPALTDLSPLLGIDEWVRCARIKYIKPQPEVP